MIDDHARGWLVGFVVFNVTFNNISYLFKVTVKIFCTRGGSQLSSLQVGGLKNE